MKKILAALLALISMMIASAFAEDKLSIVCTTFPQYDWGAPDSGRTCG